MSTNATRLPKRFKKISTPDTLSTQPPQPSRRMRAINVGALVTALPFLLPSTASAGFWQWNNNGAVPQKITPKVTRPTGPTNVTLYVVSRSELGVTWEPPLFDGGKAISKYLVEWDSDKYMTSGIASPSNPYGNTVDGPLVRSEVVSSETQFRITGLDEGQRYFVRVSAYGDGYSNAISSTPPFAIPTGTLPGYLTDVSLSVASDSSTADRLRLAWSSPEEDVNGFSVLPNGCDGGGSPPSDPDALESYRVRWDTHPSFSNAKVYDIPAVSGDGFHNQCCPSESNDEGVCSIELGAEVQTVSIKYPGSSVSSDGELFDSGGVRVVYIGSQSKSVKVVTPSPGSTDVEISSPDSLPVNSPIAVGDIIRIQDGIYLVANVDNWPGSISLATEYLPSINEAESVVQSYFTTPPTCFDVSGAGNSAENFRSHIAQSLDDSPFDESVTVSRSAVTEPFVSEESVETRIVGYDYHVTFTGQGFSSTLGHSVEELLIVSHPSSPYATVGDCGVPFVSSGVDVSSSVSLQVSTQMESGSLTPGVKYYVEVAGVNANGVGPYVSATPNSETPRSQPGLAQHCRVYAVPTSSSSLKVEWDGVYPYHGEPPSSYMLEFYDVDSVSSDPVETESVDTVDESSHYSITKSDLTPGMRYNVVIIPVNGFGEGGPSWFADFDPSGLISNDGFSSVKNYLERSCHALPTCESESIECDEAEYESFSITARSIPPPPSFEVATYPDISSENRFTEESLLVTFDSPLTNDDAVSSGIATDKFLVEWSTMSSFLAISTNGEESLWSTEVIASYSGESNENAFGEFVIDSLHLGTQYFVRVSAHNSAGYGRPSTSVPAKPMTRPDPPYEPTLSSVSREYIEIAHTDSELSDSALIGTSLLVSWQPPRIDSSDGRPDLVGDGGDAVSSYLVEWSRLSWDNYNPTIVDISITTSSGVGGSNASGLLTGSFRIIIDTTLSSNTAVGGSFLSAMIPVETDDSTIKTIIENIPNVGEVRVHSSEPFSWIVTFFSEVGDVGVSLAENNVVDDTKAEGSVVVSKIGVGSVPTHAAYDSEIIDNLDQLTSTDGLLYYTIQQLVPGMKVFVRISASNKVGFGPRRNTAPEFLSPCLQRPDNPTSLYSDNVAPYLSLHSPSSLEVHIGPPSYDGGSPLTNFLIEWDSLPTFDSSPLGDGSALGSARTNAASQVCASCVTAFDLTTHTFTYTGTEDMAKLLIPHRKIMVYFTDDEKFYSFSVLSATSSTIALSDNHLRVSSIEDMQGQTLELLGTKYVIDGLDEGRPYYVRVSSENGEMGTGKSVAAMPSNKAPRGFPQPPNAAVLSVVDKNSLRVSWFNETYVNDPTIQGFKVESFCKSDSASLDSFSFFGEKEVIELSSAGLGLVGGAFTLYFGELDTTSGVYLGHVKAAKGLNHVVTRTDLSPLLQRGESIMVGNTTYFVHDTDLFTPTRLPLSETYLNDDGDNIPVYARSKSMPIAFDASAEEVQNALQQMPNVNHVEVRREIDNVDGYQWFVTFVSNEGPQPSFTVDYSHLVGANTAGFSVARSVLGVLPESYASFTIADPTVSTFDLTNLQTGRPYYVRVSSVSDAGESRAVDTLPAFITPGGVPELLSSPSIRAKDDHTLLVSFEAEEESNGAVIEEFVIDSSRDPSFSNSSRTTALPDRKIQRVTTRAHSLPWSDSSSFTLSLGDFHGVYTVPIGHDTTVRVQNGGSILERSTGSASLSSFVARGDYISVGGFDFRVCLDISDSLPYDDFHLSLCSKDDALQSASFDPQSSAEVIDELPIFILDTSLGSAKSPAIGDVFLRSIDVLGSSKDTRGRLRRGDLIRVGHPSLGETFRISTDATRDFTDRVIPLSHEKDAQLPASLSSKALQHSTYEVQSFSIRSSTDSTILTPSNTLSSGYRLRFKFETTSTTTASGLGGCLKWDGDADDIKVELETMSGIDSVQVSKEVLPGLTNGVGAGVKYFITFTGLNVRGNVPPLQLVDVGTNGCLDAHDLGGNFGDVLAPIVVEQVEVPYIPMYEVQTTVDIPHDASAADMKAAIESLSQACTVNVSRQLNRNGFSWDITFVETKESTFSPLLVISVNGENLSAYVDPGVTAVGLQQVEVATTAGGIPYFVRVAAVNSFGLGPFAVSNPRAVEVSPQPPSEPVEVFIEAISDEEVLVQWNAPLESGGKPITYYKIEYDELSSFTGGQNGGPMGSVSVSSSAIHSISDVQTITVKIDKQGAMYLSGSFSLAFEGQSTGQLPYNASPRDVKDALEKLCNVGEVEVTRSIHCSPELSIGCMEPDGYSWLVTIVSVYEIGDQHQRYTSKLSTRTSHKLSVDGSYLSECSDVSRTTCSVGGRAVANVGTTQEIQSITIADSPFSVSFGGETSAIINLGDSISEVERKLNAYSRNGVGKIDVTCIDCSEDTIGSGDTLLVHFVSYRGDAPTVTVSDGDAVVSEVVRGTSQFVVGRSSYSTIISGFTSVNDWHVRVFAYNGIGEGLPAVAWPSPLRLAAVAPQIPNNVSTTVESATSLTMSWDRPSSIGGVDISSFVIEYDTTPSYTSKNGLPLNQLVVSEAETDASIGVVTEAYPGSNDPILRRRILIDGADPIAQGAIVIGSDIVIDGQHVTISAIDEEQCGVTCLSLHVDYTGTSTSGMKIYSGDSSMHYRYTIDGLTPGVAYFTRVAATNEQATGPFSFVGYPSTPIASTPMDVPASISWASLSSVSEDKLRVDFGSPLLEKPEGANGSPISRYHIEVATGLHEVQELRLSSTNVFENGEFSLLFKGESTGCIRIGASADTVTSALESLSVIDEVGITLSSQTDSLSTYEITFNGQAVGNEDQPLLEFDLLAGCTLPLSDNVTISVRSLQEGVTAFRPDIVSLSTIAKRDVSGFIELSVGYQGDFDQLISVRNQPVLFTVDAGSRFIDTMGDDLSAVLHRGETIVIEGEYVMIESVEVGRIQLKEYHVRGTDGSAVLGYRMDNYIGSTTIVSGDTTLTEANGQDLTLAVQVGDVIEITNDVGGKEYLTIVSVIGSSISFSPCYAGDTVETPIYAKKKVIVSANASSSQMKAAIESLPDVGSVEVSREGPNVSEGNTWYITFTSNSGMFSCSQPSWCFRANAETSSYISVSELGQDYDGNYFLTSFVSGRPKYELLGTSSYIVHDSDEWRLYSSTDALISSVMSWDVTVPLSGWSNGAVVAIPEDTASLLSGADNVAQVSFVQSGIEQSFSNIVFSAIVESSVQEVQEVSVLSDLDDLGGSFEIALGDFSDKVVVYFDDSAEDLIAKLQSLSGVGNVHAEHVELPADKYGSVWSITFHKSGDTPLLQHFGTSNLQGTGVSLIIREKVKGDVGEHHVTVDNLTPGLLYAVKIRAENEAGVGPHTTTGQRFGGGIYALARSASSPPESPTLSTGIVTRSRAEIKFTTPNSNGSDISSYKFEWATSAFESTTVANVNIACSDGSDLLGSFRFIYGSDNPSRLETTHPIDVRSSTIDIEQALNSIATLNEADVSISINATSEMEWAITFLHDVNSIGQLSLDTDDVRCQSEEPLVELSVAKLDAALPTGYRSLEMFTDDSMCSSVSLGETSSKQYLTLSARSSLVTGGSFQLMLDDQSTECIPFDASDLQLKTAIESLNHVDSVNIAATTASDESNFPRAYTITFNDNYPYGQWPALKVNPSHFGSGLCDPFVGGVDHKAVVLPIRDESLCTAGAKETVAIVADSLTALGGSFTVHYGQSSVDIDVDASAGEMEEILADLMWISDVHVSKHEHNDMDVGVAWAVTFPKSSLLDETIFVTDTHVQGRNAKVNAYPIINIASSSPDNNMSGDFRIILDGQATAPLSHQATQMKIVQELHRLNGIGKVTMLGSADGGVVSHLDFKALIDDSFTVEGAKAITVVGDLTSTIALGDQLVIGSCESLEIKGVIYEEFDGSQGAGSLYESLYSSSPETEETKLHGYSILLIKPTGELTSFVSDCSQADGVAEPVYIGSVVLTDTGVDHSLIVKAYTADLDKVEIVPERNWRGNAPRIFYKPPSGLSPHTFMLEGLDKNKQYFIRAFAKNSEGYGPPSNTLQVTPLSTVPSAPMSVMLF